MTVDINQIIAGNNNLTSSQLTAIASTATPYRLVTLGDSRNNTNQSGTQIGNVGSTAGMNIARVPNWLCAMLQDTELVGNFGISGDTLISTSTTTGWNGTARANSKTFANLIALGADVVYIQYGINDLPGATSANLILEAKKLVGELLANGLRVCLDGIMLFDPTAATPNISPANAAATLVKINEFNAAMSAWLAPMAGRAVFVNSSTAITLSATGYADPAYMTTGDTLGVHPNKRGAQAMAAVVATAIRTLIPQRLARTFTLGPLTSPNLIDWSGPQMFVSTVTGTATYSTPTWQMDPDTGVPYAEVIMTPTALASGTVQARFEVHASDIAGATPKYPINIGDVLQGSGRIVIDDGLGGAAPVQSVQMRHRMFNNVAASQFFTDWGVVSGSSDLTTMPSKIDGRFVCPAVACPIASATIDTPASGRGYYLAAFIETTTLSPVRCRIYAPALRVVSRPQPSAITPGASPYTWQNNPQPFVTNDWVNSVGRDVQVMVSGGTVTQIALVRGPTVAGAALNAVNTGLTSGTFILKPGDGITVTYAVAPTMIQMVL